MVHTIERVLEENFVLYFIMILGYLGRLFKLSPSHALCAVTLMVVYDTVVVFLSIMLQMMFSSDSIHKEWFFFASITANNMRSSQLQSDKTKSKHPYDFSFFCFNTVGVGGGHFCPHFHLRWMWLLSLAFMMMQCNRRKTRAIRTPFPQELRFTCVGSCSLPLNVPLFFYLSSNFSFLNHTPAKWMQWIPPTISRPTPSKPAKQKQIGRSAFHRFESSFQWMPKL